MTRLRITVGDQEVQATLDDSVEKTGRLPGPLSLDGQPGGDAADRIAAMDGTVSAIVGVG